MINIKHFKSQLAYLNCLILFLACVSGCSSQRNLKHFAFSFALISWDGFGKTVSVYTSFGFSKVYFFQLMITSTASIYLNKLQNHEHFQNIHRHCFYWFVVRLYPLNRGMVGAPDKLIVIAKFNFTIFKCTWPKDFKFICLI